MGKRGAEGKAEILKVESRNGERSGRRRRRELFMSLVMSLVTSAATRGVADSTLPIIWFVPANFSRMGFDFPRIFSARWLKERMVFAVLFYQPVTGRRHLQNRTGSLPATRTRQDLMVKFHQHLFDRQPPPQ